MKKKEEGFSLIEVIIVLVLLSIISAVTLPSINMIHKQEVSEAMDLVMMDLSHYSLKAQKNHYNEYSMVFEKSNPAYTYADCYKLKEKVKATGVTSSKEPASLPKKMRFKIIPKKTDGSGNLIDIPLAPSDPKDTVFFNSSGRLMTKVSGLDEEIKYLVIDISYDGQFTVRQIINGYTLVVVK